MTSDPNIAAAQDIFWAASERLLYQHTTPWELDEALVGAGFSLGPCEAQDLTGLDVVLQRQDTPVTPILSRMVAEGRIGKKGSVGFYRYPGRGGAVIDPLMEDLIREEAWFAKQVRHEVAEGMLVRQMFEAVQNCASQLRCAGFAGQDIDAILSEALSVPRDVLGRMGKKVSPD